MFVHGIQVYVKQFTTISVIYLFRSREISKNVQNCIFICASKHCYLQFMKQLSLPVDVRNNGNQHDIGEEDQQPRYLSDLHNILHIDTSMLHSVAYKVNIQGLQTYTRNFLNTLLYWIVIL